MKGDKWKIKKFPSSATLSIKCLMSMIFYVSDKIQNETQFPFLFLEQTIEKCLCTISSVWSKTTRTGGVGGAGARILTLEKWGHFFLCP